MTDRDRDHMTLGGAIGVCVCLFVATWFDGNLALVWLASCLGVGWAIHIVRSKYHA